MLDRANNQTVGPVTENAWVPKVHLDYENLD